jgi:hypothetical protein
MRTSAPAWIANGLLVLCGVASVVLCVEGIFAFALSHPQILASSDGTVGEALAYARGYYVNQDRKLVQYLADCAQYDWEDLHTRSGHVPRRRSRAWSSTRRQRGSRDSDDALSGAETSSWATHGMGWGVQGDRASSACKRSGRRVLSASSYGTVREMTSGAAGAGGTVVIQYSDNDFVENKPYVDHGTLDILPEWQYRAVVREHGLATRYYPFKHAISLLTAPWHGPPPSLESDQGAEASYFLEVLLRHRASLEGKTVVVMEIGAYDQNDRRFIGPCGARSPGATCGAARWLTAIDLSDAPRGDYYVLDGHMKPSGHEKVARLLAAELDRRRTLNR